MKFNNKYISWKLSLFDLTPESEQDNKLIKELLKIQVTNTYEYNNFNITYFRKDIPIIVINKEKRLSEIKKEFIKIECKERIKLEKNKYNDIFKKNLISFEKHHKEYMSTNRILSFIYDNEFLVLTLNPYCLWFKHEELEVQNNIYKLKTNLINDVQKQKEIKKRNKKYLELNSQFFSNISYGIKSNSWCITNEFSDFSKNFKLCVYDYDVVYQCGIDFLFSVNLIDDKIIQKSYIEKEHDKDLLQISNITKYTIFDEIENLLYKKLKENHKGYYVERMYKVLDEYYVKLETHGIRYCIKGLSSGIYLYEDLKNILNNLSI